MESNQSKLLCFGYILNNICIRRDRLPNDINDTCAMFVGNEKVMDFFEIDSSNDIDHDRVASNAGNVWTTVYGGIIIDPTIDNKTYEWKFRILHCRSSISIGIDESECKWKDDDFSGQKETMNYSLCNNGMIYTQNGYNDGKYLNRSLQSLANLPQYLSGYNIEMKLEFSKDCDYGIISFTIQLDGSNNSKSIQFNQVSKQTKYRMAISLGVPPTVRSSTVPYTSVQLIDYSQKFKTVT